MFVYRANESDAIRLIIDAGHLSVASNLVDKTAVQSIRSKRNQLYNESDFRQLESLMYDEFTVRFKDAQVSGVIFVSEVYALTII